MTPRVRRLRALGWRRCARCKCWRAPEAFVPAERPHAWRKPPRTCLACREGEIARHLERAAARGLRCCAYAPCGRMFPPRRDAGQYCSHRCAGRGRRAAALDHDARALTCPTCGQQRRPDTDQGGRLLETCGCGIQPVPVHVGTVA